MIGLTISLEGALPNGSGNSMPPPPAAHVFLSSPGTLDVVSGDGVLDITVTGSGLYDGAYQVMEAGLQAGPVNIVAPVLTGDGSPQAGESLTLTPGLWVYEDAADVPVITDAHDGAGTVSGLDYHIVPEDAAEHITVTQTATQIRGSRNAPSNSVLITGQPAPEIVLLEAGTPEILVSDGALSVTPGLWIYDGDNTPPARVTVLSNGAVLDGQSYSITQADAGETLSATETLSGVNGSRAQASNAITVINTGYAKATVLTEIDFAQAEVSGGQSNPRGGVRWAGSFPTCRCYLSIWARGCLYGTERPEGTKPVACGNIAYAAVNIL